MVRRGMSMSTVILGLGHDGADVRACCAVEYEELDVIRRQVLRLEDGRVREEVRLPRARSRDTTERRRRRRGPAQLRR